MTIDNVHGGKCGIKGGYMYLVDTEYRRSPPNKDE